MKSTSKSYRIAVIPGDGIGKEVTAEAQKVVNAAGETCGFGVEWHPYPFGADHYLRTGEIFPDSVLGELEQCQAVLLGAIGDPRVKPGLLERGILLRLRFHYDMFVNLRPARSFPNTPLPVAIPEGKRIDTVVVRENTEDFYMGIGGEGRGGDLSFPVEISRDLYSVKGTTTLSFSPETNAAVQLGLATEEGVRRIAAYACDTARRRGQKSVLLASKSNALPQIYGFWETIAGDEVRGQGLDFQVANVDALCYHLVRNPWKYNTILCPNMFGDIVSDLLAGIAGGLGVAAGANIGKGLGMFEPVHGSAPDIAGTGRANPLAAILSAGLMLFSLGETEAAARIESAVENVLGKADKATLPAEFGGGATCSAVGDAVAAAV
jgi:3-isopropylmalate dehydrogenase